MWKYILKRILFMIFVVIGVTLIVYLILNLAQGDPALQILGDHATPEAIEQLHEEMHLDDPVLVRYGRYMLGLIQGDFGLSYKTQRPVVEELGPRFISTIKLSAAGIIISIIFALPLGIVAAVKQNTLFDGASMIVSLLGISMPVFWTSSLLIMFFSLKLGWFPSQGAEGIKSIILPAVALGFQGMASIARVTRSSMLEVIRQDYMRTARAKGVPYRDVIIHHGVKNAMIPTITVIGISIGTLLGGAVMVETVFAWPGIGRLIVTSIQGRDIPMVMGCIIIFTLCISIINLVVDLLYGFVDPRVKAQYR